jgi:hypothetical protein
MLKSNTTIKHDTSENWNKALNFIPKAEEIIIYDDVFPYGIKMGDGKTKLRDLPFLGRYTLEIKDNILVVEG